jgi:hypothetical protein
VPVYACMAICRWSGVCPTTVMGVEPEIVGEPGFAAEQESTKDPAAPVGFSVIDGPATVAVLTRTPLSSADQVKMYPAAPVTMAPAASTMAAIKVCCVSVVLMVSM